MNEDGEFRRNLRILKATDYNEYILGDQEVSSNECFSLSEDVEEKSEVKDWKNIESILKTESSDKQDNLDNKDILKDLVKCVEFEDKKFDPDKICVKVENYVTETRTCGGQNTREQGSLLSVKKEDNHSLESLRLGNNNYSQSLITSYMENKNNGNIPSLPKRSINQEVPLAQVSERLNKYSCLNFGNTLDMARFICNDKTGQRLMPITVTNCDSYDGKTKTYTKLNSAIGVTMETLKQDHNSETPDTISACEFRKQSIVLDSFNRKFKCNLCEKAFCHNNSLKKHVISHGGKSFVCFICCKGFSQKTGLDGHNKIKHSSTFVKIKCPHCDQMFDYKNVLKKHIVDKHVSKTLRVEVPSTCDICQKTYPSKFCMNLHKRRQHRLDVELICNDCSMVFRSKPSLRNHIMTKHLPATIKCKQCSSIFHTRGQLYSHSVQVHKHKEKCFICDQCGKTFKYKLVLKVHLESHLNEKNYRCEKCGKSFKRSVNLYQHLRIHSEARLFSCDLCQDSFKFKHHLRQHMAVHGMASTPKYGRRGKRVVKEVTDSSSSETENQQSSFLTLQFTT